MLLVPKLCLAQHDSSSGPMLALLCPLPEVWSVWAQTRKISQNQHKAQLLRMLKAYKGESVPPLLLRVGVGVGVDSLCLESLKSLDCRSVLIDPLRILADLLVVPIDSVLLLVDPVVDCVAEVSKIPFESTVVQVPDCRNLLVRDVASRGRNPSRVWGGGGGG